MDDQKDNRESGRSEVRWITSTPRERILAGVLSLVYIGGWVLVEYAYSNRLEDHWSARVFWVVFATWLAIMLVLPLVVVCWFFAGIDRSPAWLRGRFSPGATGFASAVCDQIRSSVPAGKPWMNGSPGSCCRGGSSKYHLALDQFQSTARFTSPRRTGFM